MIQYMVTTSIIFVSSFLIGTVQFVELSEIRVDGLKHTCSIRQAVALN